MSLSNVNVGGFLGRRVDRNRISLLKGLDTALPVGFEARAAGSDPPPEAMRLAADSDLYKWLEGACYALAYQDDVVLRTEIDRVAGLIVACQHADGFIGTQVPPRVRFDRKVNHDLYCAGHLFEAAAAHCRATGSRQLLDVACRWADYLIAEYDRGNEYYQAVGAHEHPEYELGLCRLGRAAGREDYIAFGITLARLSAVGPTVADIRAGAAKLHAVRVGYLLTGLADLYIQTGRDDLLEHLPELWSELVETRMYVTGAIGDRDEMINPTPCVLPLSRDDHDTRHMAETCACLAMGLLTRRLHAITGGSRCADVIERILYNHVLGAVSLDHLANFYYNPIHVTGDTTGRSDHHHSPMTSRCRLPELHSTTCCMPNLWRFFGSLPEYIFSATDDGLAVNLYTPATLEHSLPPQPGSDQAGGGQIQLEMDTHYPWSGQVRIVFSADAPAEFALHLRIPDWCTQATVDIFEDHQTVTGGRYHAVRRTWHPGDVLTLNMPIVPRAIEPDPRVEANRGRTAFAAGPIVYCLESEDVDFPVEDARCNTSADGARLEWRENLLDGINLLHLPAPGGRELTLIPWFARANRSDDARWIVWIPTT